MSNDRADRRAAFFAAADIGEFPISILATSHGECSFEYAGRTTTSDCDECADGRIKRSRGIIEACNHCRVHEIAWKPYHDEMLRLWLLKKQ